MSVIKPLYGTSNQALACTLAGLSGNSARQSAAINNSVALFVDILVSLVVSTSANGNNDRVVLYAAGSVDGGTTYTEGANGADGSLSIPSAGTVLKPLGIVLVPFAFNTYRGGPFSLAAAFGGVLPAFVSVVVFNESNTLSAGSLTYQGVQYQSI